MAQLLPVLALGMKVCYYITLMVDILKCVFCLGRISLLGKIVFLLSNLLIKN